LAAIYAAIIADPRELPADADEFAIGRVHYRHQDALRAAKGIALMKHANDNRPALTAERLRELLDYDSESGVFVWKHRADTFSKLARITTKASARLNSGQRSKQSSSDTARLLIPSKRIV
jgi:hypothetical protein